MKEFLTARDIEDLAARGVKQIPIGGDIILTDVARETATALGITLVNAATTAPVESQPGPQVPTPLRSLPIKTAPHSTALGPKPKGCLHSHGEPDSTAPVAAPSAGMTSATPSGSVVERLADAIRQLSR